METDDRVVDLDKVRAAHGMARELLRVLGLSCLEENVFWHIGQQADDKHLAIHHSAEDQAICVESRKPIEAELAEATLIAVAAKAGGGMGKTGHA